MLQGARCRNGASATVVGYKDRLRAWFGIKRGSGEEGGEPGISDARNSAPAGQSASASKS